MKNKYVLLLINVLFYTYSCVVVYGKTEEKSVLLEKFTTNNGLSDNHINDLLKDKSGIIWIATDFGVSRYDGTHFNKLDDIIFPAYFKNKQVEGVFLLGDQLIFQIKNTGLTSYNPFTKSVEVISWSAVRKVCVVSNSVYYFKENGFLYEYQPNKKRTAYYLGKINYFEFNKYKNNLYFLIRNEGLIKFNTVTKAIEFRKKNRKLFKDISFPLVSAENLFLNDNKLYAITSAGRTVKSAQKLIDENITYFGYDLKKQPLYISKTKIVHSESLDFNNLITRYQLQDCELRKVVQVDPHTYFVLTNQGLLKFSIKKLISQKIDISKLSNPNDIQVRRRIIPISATEQLYLGYPGIIHVVGNNRFIINYENRPLPCFDGIKLGNNVYIISEGAGVFEYNLSTRKLEKIVAPLISPRANFCAISLFHNQLLLVSQDTILIYHPLTKAAQTIPLVSKQTPYCVKVDLQKNELLIGTKDKLLIYRTFNNSIRFVQAIPFIASEIRDILISNDQSTLYIATSNGCYRLRRKNYQIIQHILDPENKSNNLICTVNEAKNGKIWMTTFAGLIHYSPVTKKVIYINQKNGLHNIEYNYKASAWLNNDLYIGGLNNYEVVHTTLFKAQKKQNQLFLSSSSINSFNSDNRYFYSPNNQQTVINYRTDNQELTLQFSSTNLSESATFAYSYKINNGPWESMDNATIRFAYLPYGTYQLTVRLIDQLGTQVALKKMTIIAETPFYKKQLFIIGLFITLLLFSFLIIFLIIQRTRAIEATKKRIAMDLHDEAGTILTRTLLFVRMNNQTAKTAFTEKIESNIQELLFSIRAFMTSLSVNKATSYSLGDELQEFYFKNSQESERIFLFTNLIEQEISLSNELYRDIKLCVFEITNNFIKHSNGDKLSVFLLLKSKKITLLFDDNGSNFEPDQLTTGNGLRNIKKRTERNKGEVSYAKKDENSIFTLTFPL